MAPDEPRFLDRRAGRSARAAGRVPDRRPRARRIFIGGRDSYDRGRRAALEAGVEPPTLHECRHGYVALMIAAGVNGKALSTFMGHANIRITLDRYGHPLPGAEDGAAGLLDAFLVRQLGGAGVNPDTTALIKQAD
jgi:integrase